MTRSNPLVPVLRAYGPSAANSHMYDEFVMNAAAKHGVEPLDIEQPLVELVGRTLEHDTRSIILTGTAGDGKTYTARRAYAAVPAPVQGKAAWTADAKQVAISAFGRRIIFIKDLSEFNDNEKDQLIRPLANALLDPDARSNTTYVICVNDGQLLKFWRDRREQHHDYNHIYTIIQDMMRNDEGEDARIGLVMHNLSRGDHADVLGRLLDALVDHDAWEHCSRCPAFDAQAPRCPIRINLQRLRADHTLSIRARLTELVRIAAANDMHLPMRQLILLVVNAILGIEREGRRQLLTCKAAREIAEEKAYAATNIYDNLFGLNLGDVDRERHRAFAVLAMFGLGQETTNGVDAHLVDPRQKPPAPIPHDPHYGTRLTGGLSEAYRHGQLTDFDAFRRALESQRRRLFFTAESAGGEHPFDPWCLTIYHSGGRYLDLIRALGADDDAVIDRVRSDLVKGLNRAFTGLMVETSSELYLGTSVGTGHDRPSLVLDVDPVKTRPHSRLPFVRLDACGINNRPRLLIMDRQDEVAVLELRPLIFEYLIRVAQGALPSSFSRQCYEELRHFRLQALNQLREPGAQGSLSDLRLIQLDDATGSIAARPFTL